jgi:signal recognition particle subunit SRP72
LTKHIAQVNSLGISSEEINPYISHRLFHSSPNFLKNDRPFEYQQYVLRQDEYAIDLLAFKYPGVARSTSSYLSSKEISPTVSPSANTISVLNAAAHARSETGKAGLKVILPLLEQRPSDVGLILTVVHLYLLTNNHGSAILLMEKFLSRLEQSTASSDADVRYAPGLVGTLVSLYDLQGRKSNIRTELANAAAYWRSKRKSDSSEAILHPSLLKAAGTALLESTDLEDTKKAASIFEELHTADPNDRYSAAGLVAALAVTDPSQISTSLLEALTPAARLMSGIDTTALEDAGVAKPSRTLVVQPAVRKRAAEEETAQKKRKKIRKSRMPKDFEEGKNMDPERWLPLRDRSYWRPKGKKGKKKAEGLTQGGFVEDKGTQQGQNQTSAGGGGSGGGGSAAKKKKKGKK